MMKHFFVLCILLLPLLLAAQTDGSSVSGQTEFNFNGTAGYVTVGSQTYSQLRFLPELKFHKFGIGLDLDILINSDMNVRSEDWDDPKDIINKIYYIRYAERDNPFYLRVQGFSDYTLGHGLIMNNYTNRLLYPTQRNIGAMVGFNLKLPFQPGAEVFSSDLIKNEILAAAAHFKPFTLSDKKSLTGLTIGALFAIDRNQYGKYEDKDGDGVPDVLDPDPNKKNFRHDLDGDGLYNSVLPDANGMYTTEDPDMDGDGILDSPLVNSYVKDHIELYDPALVHLLDNEILPLRRYGDAKEVIIAGLNYSLPLVENDNFRLEHYAEYAKINGYGSGFIFPGFYTKFLIFDLNLEGRRFSDKFIPAYFDHLYDEQRSGVVGDTVLVTKDQSLDPVKSSLGWYGKLSADIAKSISITAAYQDMYGEDTKTGKSVMAKISLDPRWIRNLVEASVSYSQSNVAYFSLKKLQTPSAAINGIVSYRLNDKTVLSGRYSERYVDFDGDSRIKGKMELLKCLSLLVEFQL